MDAQKPTPKPRPMQKLDVPEKREPKRRRNTERNREKRTKREFVKKDKVYMCTNAAGDAFRIYANDEAEARKIFKGIHKEPAVTVEEKKREFKRKKHLTDKPFKDLNKKKFGI